MRRHAAAGSNTMSKVVQTPRASYPGHARSHPWRLARSHTEPVRPADPDVSGHHREARVGHCRVSWRTRSFRLFSYTIGLTAFGHPELGIIYGSRPRHLGHSAQRARSPGSGRPHAPAAPHRRHPRRGGQRQVERAPAPRRSRRSRLRRATSTPGRSRRFQGRLVRSGRRLLPVGAGLRTSPRHPASQRRPSRDHVRRRGTRRPWQRQTVERPVDQAYV